MLKEAVFIFLTVLAISLAYPAEETIDGQPKAFAVKVSPNQEPQEPESLEGAESANPQWGWGRRGWGGGWGGGYGRGWGGGYGRGWGGGYGGGWGGGYGRGWGGGWGGGWGRRGWGWGR